VLILCRHESKSAIYIAFPDNKWGTAVRGGPFKRDNYPVAATQIGVMAMQKKN